MFDFSVAHRIIIADCKLCGARRASPELTYLALALEVHEDRGCRLKAKKPAAVVVQRAMSAGNGQQPLMLSDDLEVWPWVYGILHGEPLPAAGFLQIFAQGIVKADAPAYHYLRPAILRIKAVHPEYECKCRGPGRATEKDPPT